MRSLESSSLITLLSRAMSFKVLTCLAHSLEALESPHTAWRREDTVWSVVAEGFNSTNWEKARKEHKSMKTMSEE